MPDFDEINAAVIEEYRANGGALGGPFAGETLILLHHIGAKSGIERVSPLAYVAEGDRMFVVASKAGLPENPAWFYNLLAHPDVTVELGTETFPVRAVVITGVNATRSMPETRWYDHSSRITRPTLSGSSPSWSWCAADVWGLQGGTLIDSSWSVVAEPSVRQRRPPKKE